MAKITETEWIWRDGEFVRWADATVHVLCHSLQFGSSAFEGIRAYCTPRGPAVFRLEDHLQRLLDSCRIYRMDVKYSLDELVAACCELIERNNIDACYLRPMVLRGYGASGMVPFDSPVEVYLPCWPWGAYLGDGALENGVDACVASGIASRRTRFRRWRRWPATISAVSSSRWKRCATDSPRASR